MNILKNIYIFLLLFIVVNSYGQTNIAPLASISTSYISSWEQLDAINNEIDPQGSADKTGGAYGNWQGDAFFNQWNWVQYTFDSYFVIYQSNVYWWTDGGGIQLPYNTYVEYWDIINKSWVKPANVDGNGVKPDQYNITKFDTLLTNKIRLNFISTAAQGILEWKVFGNKVNNVPDAAFATVEPPLAPGAKSTVTLVAKDTNNNFFDGYSFLLNAIVTNNIANNTENYIIDDTTTNVSVYGITLPATNILGQTSFNIKLPDTVDPTDGISIDILFNGGLSKLTTLKYFEPGIEPPVLTADTTDNNVDNSILIAFNHNIDWQNAITDILINNTKLNNADYAIYNGLIGLLPANGNSLLTTAGKKQVTVVAKGYKNAQVEQTINCGIIDAKRSFVDSTVALYRPSKNVLKIFARDQFGNPVKNYQFSYTATVINNNTENNEIFVVNSNEITSNIAVSAILPATDSNGVISMGIEIPVDIDVNDGLKIKILLNFGIDLVTEVSYIRAQNEKWVYISKEIEQREWSWDKTRQSKNFVMFWGNKSGPDPLNPTGGAQSFNPDDILKKMEHFYSFYLDTMQFIANPNEGNMAKYKYIIVVMNTWDVGFTGSTPTGGSYDGVIGAMWVPVASGDFVLSHEFGHCFQATIPIQTPGKGFLNINDNHQVGMFWEACANFMAYEVTGEPGNILTSHFMNTAMMQYLSTVSYRQYESSFWPMFVTQQYGYLGFAKLWQEAEQGDHPFDALVKALDITRDSMLNAAGLYAMKNVNWDYKIGPMMRNYLKGLDQSQTCRKYTYLDKLNDGSNNYIVPREMAPGDFGYNIVPVFPDNNSQIVKASVLPVDDNSNAGWRYGFVAVDSVGNCRYSNVFSQNTGWGTFNILPTDKDFYLVVIATPNVSNTYSWDPGFPKVYRYPYMVKFDGALPAGYKDGYNSQKAFVPGAAHTNGGGWVASTATVASTVYVGPNAQVLGSASVSGYARIDGFAVVNGSAVVSDSAVVCDNAIVGSTAKLSGFARVEKSARVFGGRLIDNAVVTGNAVAINCNLSGNAVLKDLAWLNNITLKGTAIVGGDMESFASCAEGVYLQNSRNSCDKKLWLAKNDDINNEPSQYVYPIGQIPAAPANLLVNTTGATWATFSFEPAPDDFKIVNYMVFANSKPVGLISSQTDTVYGLNPQTQYEFYLRAVDHAGNISAPGNTVSAQTTLSGVSQVTQNNCFDIYPNPVVSSLNISSNVNGIANVEIFNCLGKVVYKGQFTNKLSINNNQIGCQGVYIIKINANNTTVTKRVILSQY